MRPVGGSAWAPEGRPQRQPANYHKLHGVRQFHGCYSISDDTLWGVVRRRKSATHTLAALKSIRAAAATTTGSMSSRTISRPTKAPPSATGPHRNNVELCFTPTYSSWANPIEAHSGPLREFVLNNPNHPNHIVLTRRLHAYLRWRNAKARPMLHIRSLTSAFVVLSPYIITLPINIVA